MCPTNCTFCSVTAFNAVHYGYGESALRRACPGWEIGVMSAYMLDGSEILRDNR